MMLICESTLLLHETTANFKLMLLQVLVMPEGVLLMLRPWN